MSVYTLFGCISLKEFSLHLTKNRQSVISISTTRLMCVALGTDLYSLRESLNTLCGQSEELNGCGYRLYV
jgi:hypothetical protein